MFVAASTRCFPDFPLSSCLDRLADLEYNAAEIVIGDRPNDLSLDLVEKDLNQAIRVCMTNRQVRPISLLMDINPSESKYNDKFTSVCRLAKALRLVTISVRSCPWGTPYNEEIERLRQMVQYSSQHGIVVGIMNQTGCLADLPESIVSLCNTVPGLALSLDPSYYVFHRDNVIEYETLSSLVCHVRLRDTSAAKFQVQIGQGVLEYGKLVSQLNKSQYGRALCVDLEPQEDINQESEMRKMRLLLDSIL